MIGRTLLIAALAGTAALSGPAAKAGPSILLDAGTGRVIESDDAFHRWYPASLTKLMTAYVAFRAVQAGEVTMSSPIVISKAAAKLPPSKMGYKPGSELTLDTALKIIMVKSANDVAASIGASIAGSVAGYAERMNAESRRLGMTDSNWVNQHGLHDEKQYTSPRDLALLAMAIRRDFPQYLDYFSIEGLLADGKEMPNHNNLIGRFPGADGMKTGYICPSGFNLVASATRDGRTLLAVVVGGTSVDTRDEEAAAMLARGFASAPGTGPAIEDLPRTATGPNEPGNMFDQLCSKEARARKQKEWKELQAAIKEGRKQAFVSAYIAEAPEKRNLVTIKLGGATGPVPKAAIQYADVPIPTWRPDLPPPVLAQGDGAAAVQ